MEDQAEIARDDRTIGQVSRLSPFIVNVFKIVDFLMMPSNCATSPCPAAPIVSGIRPISDI